jgi:MarR family transcriptional regulator, organic hydroperoxide resistance regulator
LEASGFVISSSTGKPTGYNWIMPDLQNWPTARLLSTAARLVEHAWNEKLASLGLTHAGVIALEVLDAEGALAQAQLAAKVRVQAQTMGKTLSRLEAHGHITRVRSQSDRRSQLVSISDLGQQALESSRELERNLTPGGDAGADDLRDRLASVIRRLGTTRWGGTVPEPMELAGNEGLSDHG